MKNKEVSTETVTIDKIEFDIYGRKLSLSLDEARKLQAALNSLLGTTTPVYIYPPPVAGNPVVVPQPYYPPLQPWPGYPAPYIGDPIYNNPVFTCQTSGCNVGTDNTVVSVSWAK